MKREASFQTKWNQYLRARPIPGHFELKQTRTNTFSFSSFEDHQLDSLAALEEGHFIWKHSDADPRKKPCDSQCIPPLPAYVVIKFPEACTAIRVGDLLDFMKSTKQKSISYEQAKKIAERIVKGI